MALTVRTQGWPGAGGQTPAVDLPSFEVASVRRSSSGRSAAATFHPEGFTATGASVRMLIETAYGVQPYQVIGGPRWAGNDTFDVIAKVPAGSPASREEILLMLRSLLSERFALRTLHENGVTCRGTPLY